MQHPEKEEKCLLLGVTTEVSEPENSPRNKLYIPLGCCRCTGKSRVECRANSQKQAASCSCTAPGIVVDAKEVASRLAIWVLIVHLAQGGLVGKHS